MPGSVRPSTWTRCSRERTRRPARRATDQDRADHRPQDRQGARPDDPAGGAGAGGRDDPVVDRRVWLGSGGLGLFVTPLVVEAQEAGKVARIGILRELRQPPTLRSIPPGLRESGWTQGQHLTVETALRRWSAARGTRLSRRDRRLQCRRSSWPPAAMVSRAVKPASSTIPIVDHSTAIRSRAARRASRAPVETSPGFSNGQPELGGKRLQFLRETVAGARACRRPVGPGNR